MCQELFKNLNKYVFILNLSLIIKKAKLWLKKRPLNKPSYFSLWNSVSIS